MIAIFAKASGISLFVGTGTGTGTVGSFGGSDMENQASSSSAKGHGGADTRVASNPKQRERKRQKTPALGEDVESEDAKKLLESLKMSSFDGLLDKRIVCPGCNKSRKNYCCKCLKVLPGCTAPSLKLPIHLDIVHHVSLCVI